MSNGSGLKALNFVGSSREDLKVFPEEVRQDIGYALFEAQRGQKPEAGSRKALAGIWWSWGARNHRATRL